MSYKIKANSNIVIDPLTEMHEALIRPGPDLVICDEGHRIKNCHASISKALKNIRTKFVI